MSAFIWTLITVLMVALLPTMTGSTVDSFHSFVSDVVFTLRLVLVQLPIAAAVILGLAECMSPLYADDIACLTSASCAFQLVVTVDELETSDVVEQTSQDRQLSWYSEYDKYAEDGKNEDERLDTPSIAQSAFLEPPGRVAAGRPDEPVGVEESPSNPHLAAGRAFLSGCETFGVQASVDDIFRPGSAASISTFWLGELLAHCPGLPLREAYDELEWDSSSSVYSHESEVPRELCPVERVGSNTSSVLSWLSKSSDGASDADICSDLLVTGTAYEASIERAYRVRLSQFVRDRGELNARSIALETIHELQEPREQALRTPFPASPPITPPSTPRRALFAKFRHDRLDATPYLASPASPATSFGSEILLTPPSSPRSPGSPTKRLAPKFKQVKEKGKVVAQKSMRDLRRLFGRGQA